MASLQALHEALMLLDPDQRFQGISYALTRNESLGLSDGADFHVGLPFQIWPKNLSDAPKDFESSLAVAIKDVLARGVEASTASHGTVIIDVTQLWTGEWPNFFDSKDFNGETLTEAIGRIVSCLAHNTTLVIRILLGLNNAKSPEQVWEQDIRPEVEKVFWPDGTSVFTKPRTEIFIGFYSPSLTPEGRTVTTTTARIHALKDAVSPLLNIMRGISNNIRTSIEPFLPNDLRSKIADIDEMLCDEHALKYLTRLGFPSLCWNHAKIIAVDGKILMTGGALYYPFYGDDQAWISDIQGIIRGDAAISAHAYCDYIWTYLNAHHPHDIHSFRWHTKPQTGMDVSWDNADHAPLFSRQPQLKDGLSVLTVNRIGDYIANNGTFRYPCQALDCFRDLIVNLIWHVLDLRAPSFMWAFDALVLRPISDEALLPTMIEANISPVAWASRIARCRAVEMAQHNVYIDTDTIANCLYRDDKGWLKFRESINDVLGLFGKERWDGNLWPYDLIAALAEFMRRVGDKEAKAVHILLTTPLLPGREYTGWEDPIHATELKRRIRSMTQHLFGGDDDDQYNAWFDTRCKIRRISKDASWSNHCKVVCLDHTLLYVGSDNFYPNYNTEHGIWIDNKQAIENWYESYWKPRWDASPDADLGSAASQ